jgi:hypothetical protein
LKASLEFLAVELLPRHELEPMEIVYDVCMFRVVSTFVVLAFLSCSAVGQVGGGGGGGDAVPSSKPSKVGGPRKPAAATEKRARPSKQATGKKPKKAAQQEKK